MFVKNICYFVTPAKLVPYLIREQGHIPACAGMTYLSKSLCYSPTKNEQYQVGRQCCTKIQHNDIISLTDNPLSWSGEAGKGERVT